METLKAQQIFKDKYSFTKHPNTEKFKKWAAENTFSLETLFPSVAKTQIHHLDLSSNTHFIGGKKEFNDLSFFENKLNLLQKKVPNHIIAGGYLEKRALYTSDIYKRANTSEQRNIHLGIDFWLPQNTPIHALLDGEIVCIANDKSPKGYGGLIILKHQTTHFSFYTLYGHTAINRVFKQQVGNTIKKGTQIAVLGNSKENGNWVPHLHFQILLTLLDFKDDFPGVAFESEIEIWKSICPNPNTLFKIKDL